MCCKMWMMAAERENLKPYRVSIDCALAAVDGDAAEELFVKVLDSVHEITGVGVDVASLQPIMELEDVVPDSDLGRKVFGETQGD